MVKPKRQKQVFKFLLHLRDGMQTAGANAGSGSCQIDPFGFQAGVERGEFESSFAGLEEAFEFLLEFV